MANCLADEILFIDCRWRSFWRDVQPLCRFPDAKALSMRRWLETSVGQTRQRLWTRHKRQRQQQRSDARLWPPQRDQQHRYRRLDIALGSHNNGDVCAEEYLVGLGRRKSSSHCSTDARTLTQLGVRWLVEICRNPGQYQMRSNYVSKSYLASQKC